MGERANRRIGEPACRSGGVVEWWSGGVVAANIPEGLNDRSQAIYCLECVQDEVRPVGTV
jgi:hypothetical protein